MKRDIYIANTPLTEALDRWRELLAGLAPLKNRFEKIAVDDSLGRVTAAPVFATHSSPFYNAAAMDGIAVSFRDTVGASESNPATLKDHQFSSVNTGNAIASNYDAVIMIEDVHKVDNRQVEITGAATPWQHIRTIGEDIVATELILPEGHLIRPLDMGAMLAAGVNQVQVYKPVKVLVLPTGSDVVQPGDKLTDGNIIEFNSRILTGYLTEWGADAKRGPIIPDEPSAIKAALQDGVAHYDLVLINAGASTGAKDFTAKVLKEIGQVVIHGVNIKPGKPVILAEIDETPVIGLPGYPVSAVLTMHLFAQELIYTLQGKAPPTPEVIEATLSRPLSSKLGIEDFVRVKLGQVSKNLMATPTGSGAGAVMSLAQADGIMRVPAGSEGVGAQEKVAIELLRPLTEIHNTLVFIGSHDNILDVLANMLHQLQPTVRLSSAHVGSMGGIMAIRRGEAHLAGTHLLDEESGEYNIPFIKQYLKDIPLQLINMAYREQGLLVPKGNPKKIRGFQDLVRDEISFINRQKGAGTRILTDHHLKKLDIECSKIRGYEREEYTHMNIASAVSTGSADTGLAIRAAAVAMDLDFIPVASERYDIIVPASLLEDFRLVKLLETIRGSEQFQQTVLKLGGYDLRECGKVVYEQ